MQTRVGGRTWPWLPVVYGILPWAMGIKRGEQMQDPVRSSNQELVTDWPGQREPSGRLPLRCCFPSSHQVLVSVEGIPRRQAGRQVGKWGQVSSQHVKGKVWGSRGKPVLNSQVLTGTLRRHQHPQGGPHLGLPTTQGHLSFPRASACLWGLVPSPFRSLSLSD